MQIPWSNKQKQNLKKRSSLNWTNECNFFSFWPPIGLFEEGIWLFGMTSFEVTNSVFIVTDENNTFSITRPSYWTSRGGTEMVIKIQELLELREEDDVKLHVEEARNRGTLWNRR